MNTLDSGVMPDVRATVGFWTGSGKAGRCGFEDVWIRERDKLVAGSLRCPAGTYLRLDPGASLGSVQFAPQRIAADTQPE